MEVWRLGLLKYVFVVSILGKGWFTKDKKIQVDGVFHKLFPGKLEYNHNQRTKNCCLSGFIIKSMTNVV